jgi:hypothetical protein
MERVAIYTAHQTDDVTFELDEYRDAEGHQMLLAHLRVHQWTPSAMRRIRHDWSVFRKAITTNLYALPMLSPEDPEFSKWERFVTSMGWRPIHSKVLCHDGIERPLYIHTVS